MVNVVLGLKYTMFEQRLSLTYLDWMNIDRNAIGFISIIILNQNSITANSNKSCVMVTSGRSTNIWFILSAHQLIHRYHMCDGIFHLRKLCCRWFVLRSEICSSPVVGLLFSKKKKMETFLSFLALKWPDLLEIQFAYYETFTGWGIPWAQ